MPDDPPEESLSTPASPTPLTEDGDELLVELRSLLSALAASTRAGSSGKDLSDRHVASAIRLLRAMPASRDVVLDHYFSCILDSAMASHLENGHTMGKSNETASVLVPALSAIKSGMQDLIGLKESLGTAPTSSGWVHIVAGWSLRQLGELSSKHAVKVAAVAAKASGSTGPGGNGYVSGVRETMPVWLGAPAARLLVDLAIDCISKEAMTDAHDQAQMSADLLLDTSVKHGERFDWVVAQVGGCFPDTIIARVLWAGLRDFAATDRSDKELDEDDEDQDDWGSAVNLAKVPKISSVVGIVGHLAVEHDDCIRTCVKKMLWSSLSGDGSSRDMVTPSGSRFKGFDGGVEDDRESIVPYLLHLARLSDVLREALASCIVPMVSLPGVQERAAAMAPDWSEKYFLEPDGLALHCVGLLRATGGQVGRDLVNLLMDLSVVSTKASKDVGHASRLVLELLLSDLTREAHAVGDANAPELLKALREQQDQFVRRYMLAKDPFHKKAFLILGPLLALPTKGFRLFSSATPVVSAIRFGLLGASNMDSLSTVIQYIRETEVWTNDGNEVLRAALWQCVLQCKRTSQGRQRQPPLDGCPEARPMVTKTFLKNLAALLEMEGRQSGRDPDSGAPSTFKPVSSIRKAFIGDFCSIKGGGNNSNLLAEILPLLSTAEEDGGDLEQAGAVLKILAHVPFAHRVASSASDDVTLMFKGARHLSVAFFRILAALSIQDRQESAMSMIAFVADNLARISQAHPAGLQAVLRFLLETATRTQYAILFGGKLRGSNQPQTAPRQGSLYQENLKFGAMPTHPLGTSTVFHAGTIGQGKRRPPPDLDLPEAVVRRNTTVLVSFLFKICCNLSGGRNGLVPNTQDLNNSVVNNTKQLALLLVDLVSPDVMYNGLPWPDEDFTRVTVERDLIISRTFEDHPLLWNIMEGLAEARPSLCYCSVLLRGLLAVQMAYWQTSIVPSARLCPPEKLSATKRVLRLLSVGQFVPPPLDSVSDIIDPLHPFHVHCVLYDVWNYIRDNVPSPVSFLSNGAGSFVRDFEPYKAYKLYCERLRLIMINHIVDLPEEFKRFFVDVADRQEQALKLAMEY